MRTYFHFTAVIAHFSGYKNRRRKKITSLLIRWIYIHSRNSLAVISIRFSEKSGLSMLPAALAPPTELSIGVAQLIKHTTIQSYVQARNLRIQPYPEDFRVEN